MREAGEAPVVGTVWFGRIVWSRPAVAGLESAMGIAKVAGWVKGLCNWRFRVFARVEVEYTATLRITFIIGCGGEWLGTLWLGLI